MGTRGKIFFKIKGQHHPVVWATPSDGTPENLAAVASDLHYHIGGKWDEQDPQKWHDVLRGFSRKIDFGGAMHWKDAKNCDYEAWVEPEKNIISIDGQGFYGGRSRQWKLYDDTAQKELAADRIKEGAGGEVAPEQLQRSEGPDAWEQLKKAAEEAIEILKG